MSRRPALFEYREEFEAFMPDNGVPNAGRNYVSWMNRAVRRLGHSIGRADLSCEADVQGLMRKLLSADQRTAGNRLLKHPDDEKNQISTFRKYAQMVQSNYLGKFANVPAALTPPANDVPDEPPSRIMQSIYRIIRDTAVSREVKRLYEFRCQVCGVRLEIEPGVFYAEAHHIQPLGKEHNGLDVRENLLCLCPNHHAQFDYFAIELDLANLKLNKHAVGKSFLDYHNKRAKEGGFRSL